MNHSYHIHNETCMNERKWPIFVASSIGTFSTGLILIFTYRFINRLCPPNPNISKAKPNHQWNQRLDKQLTNMWDIHLTPTWRQNALCLKCSQSISQTLEWCRHWAIYLISYQWLPGQIFIALSMILSLISFSIYAYEATLWPKEMEKCGHKGRRLRSIDFILNLYFLIHFIVRLLASRDSLSFWLQSYSMLDYLTVPPILLGFFIHRSWTGFRFVRIFRVVNLAEVLHNLSVIKSASSLRLCQLCTIFLSIWFAGAGMMHLLENSGDIFDLQVDFNRPSLTYFDALYFTIVTMSTVGYGDLTPVTYLGRMYVCIFILLALATFASAIPEIAEMLFRVSKYEGVYQKPIDKSHIVVCGDINTNSVKTFLDNFLHEDRQRTDVDVVFINRSSPDLELQSLLRRHFLNVKYFQGTVMDQQDLKRVQMDIADACLILASSTTIDAYQKDAANIMRFVAVKNYAQHVRIIVQLLQTENKIYLHNSAYWNWDGGDEIICFNELKLGFLAQSCIAPGFSTLLTNLYLTHSLKRLDKALTIMEKPKEPGWQFAKYRKPQISHSKSHSFEDFQFNAPRVKNIIQNLNCMKSSNLSNRCESNNNNSLTKSNELLGHSLNNTNRGNKCQTNEWANNYFYGVSMEIYSADFSKYFNGLTFNQAALICHQKLNILLIAIIYAQGQRKDDDLDEDENDDIEMESTFDLTIAPTLDNDRLITQGMSGIFICDSQKNANKVTHYCDEMKSSCNSCNNNIDNWSKIKQITSRLASSFNLQSQNESGLKGESENLRQITNYKLDQHDMSSKLENMEYHDTDRTTIKLSTEHLQLNLLPPCQSQSSLYDNENHENIDNMYTISKQKQVSFKKNMDITGMFYYSTCREFEDALISPMSATYNDLLNNHILLCILAEADAPPLGLHSFVMPLRSSIYNPSRLKPIILMGNVHFLVKEWPNIANFPLVYALPGSALSRTDLNMAQIQNVSMCVIVGSRGHIQADDANMLDKEVILCTLNIKAMRFDVGGRGRTSKGRQFGYEIPIITELMTDNNIHYLDPSDPGGLQIPASLTAPFAKGMAFSSSVLDVLASTAYFDRNSMTLIRYLVTGGLTPKVEQFLANNGGLTKELDDEQTLNQRPDAIDYKLIKSSLCSRIEQLSVTDRRLLDHSAADENICHVTYSNLFCHALKSYGILCLGIYRQYPKPLEANNECLGRKATRHASTGLPDKNVTKLYSKSISFDTIDYTRQYEVPCINRYVITNPQAHFKLHPTDEIFCFCPYDQD